MDTETVNRALEIYSAARPARRLPADPPASAVSRDGLLTRGLTGAVRLSMAAVALPVRLAMPILMSRPLEPARVAADNLLQTAAVNVTIVLQERPQLTDDIVCAIADRYVAALAGRPDLLAGLVEKVADGYIAFLEEHPEKLERLVQVVGDRYIEYLHKNPENVQDLVAGQSVTMATEVVEEVRSRSAVADNALEHIVRSLLRKKPRAELAPPALQTRPAAGEA
jgi:hypothetical protein